jgi:hypothetical protein
VGLHATDTARPEALQASVPAAPLQALEQGEMRVTSNRPLPAVLQAISPAEPSSAAPWPFAPTTAPS